MNEGIRVRVHMPNGNLKQFNMSHGSTAADLVRQVPELNTSEFSIRMRGEDLQSDDSIQPEVLEKLELKPNDELFFTPKIVGG